MPETFSGLVQIQDSASANTRISLNGDMSTVAVGGPGQDGMVTLQNTHGQTTLLLAGNAGTLFGSGGIELETAQGQKTVIIEAATGRLFVGGGGQPGHIQLQNPQGQGCISLSAVDANVYVGGSGQSGSLALRTADANPTISLEGQSGQVTVGSLGQQGMASIRNDKGRETIRLDGQSASVVAGTGGTSGAFAIKDSNDHDAILLAGKDASVRIGGGAQIAHVILIDGQAQQTVVLSGQGSMLLGGTEGGFVSVKDSQGHDAIRLYGKDASIRLGGNGDGAVILMNGQSKLTGVLSGKGHLILGGNGESGFISVKDSQGHDTIRFDGQHADVTVGAAGQAGDVTVKNNAGNDTIRVNGQSGDILLLNADFAEEFDASGAQSIEPGTVVILDGEDRIETATRAYDKRVAGVVSGAGSYRPGIVLDRHPAKTGRIPIALAGKVYCKVDATDAPIEIGDPLTSSQVPGHAMKATDPARAFGAVLGKALRPLQAGTGLIPMLVALQ